MTDANKLEFINLKVCSRPPGVAHRRTSTAVPIAVRSSTRVFVPQTSWRLEKRIKTQMEAVRSGFYKVMPEAELLKIGFDDRELELILCGIPKVDIADWKAHCEYKSGFKVDSKVSTTGTALHALDIDVHARMPWQLVADRVFEPL